MYVNIEKEPIRSAYTRSIIFSQKHSDLTLTRNTLQKNENSISSIQTSQKNEERLKSNKCLNKNRDISMMDLVNILSTRTNVQIQKRRRQPKHKNYVNVQFYP